MEEIKAALLSADGRQIMPPTLIEQVRNLYAQLSSLSTGLSSLQDIIKKISESGFNVIDENGNVGMKYDERGLDAALLSSHFQGLVNILINIDIFGTTEISQYCSENDGNTSTLLDKFCYDDENKVFVIAHQSNNSIDLVSSGIPQSNKIYLDISSNKTYRWDGSNMVSIGSTLELGETSLTAYAGNKGKANADAISTLLNSLQTLTTNNNADHKSYNDGILLLQSSLRTLSESLSVTQTLIAQVTENGFHVTDANGNVGMKYDESGLDAALLSSHFQGLINSLITTLINSARGTTLAPLVNSLIPSTYLPSYVDDVIDIDIFGTSAIAQYSSDNDGNTNVLPDKLCYDDENKVLVIARQVNNTIDIVNSNSPENGKIYLDIVANVSYRWSGTSMVAIGNSMALGETSATAYAGDKGKQNATDIASVRSLISVLSAAITVISSMIVQVNNGGLNVADANGNIVLKYDENGLDVALLSTHLISLIKNIEGLGLKIGTTAGTAFDGAKGSQLDTTVKALQASMAGIENIAAIEEEAFVICDQNGYVIFKIDANGPDFVNISSHATSVLKNAGVGSLQYRVVEIIN